MITIKHLLTKQSGSRTLVWAVADSSIHMLTEQGRYTHFIVLWGTVEDGMASRRMPSQSDQVRRLVNHKFGSGYKNSSDSELKNRVQELFEKHDVWEQLSGEASLVKHKTSFDK